MSVNDTITYGELDSLPCEQSAGGQGSCQAASAVLLLLPGGREAMPSIAGFLDECSCLPFPLVWTLPPWHAPMDVHVDLVSLDLGEFTVHASLPEPERRLRRMARGDLCMVSGRRRRRRLHPLTQPWGSLLRLGLPSAPRSADAHAAFLSCLAS
jgi:hypothetical protein